ncbi:MAG TPA: NTP transferase domain-containing protein [Candidatus Elarobacter sp.]|nr:NTP transferase domain-containing protein [Candidatus Elarobacter sp.]
MRTVVLGGGRSQRMGFDKLVAPFAGEPLARRVARGLLELEPLFVTTPAVAEAISGLPGVQVVVTEPTAGPSATLALAHAAIPSGSYLAVLACDLPFVDAARVRAFVARVPDDADLAWPVVAGVPGHPVVWSPSARARIAALRDDEPPMRVRLDAALRTVALDELDDAYVLDVDTPDGWARAEKRAVRA